MVRKAVEISVGSSVPLWLLGVSRARNFESRWVNHYNIPMLPQDSNEFAGQTAPAGPAQLRIDEAKRKPSRGWSMALLFTVLVVVVGLGFLLLATQENGTATSSAPLQAQPSSLADLQGKKTVPGNLESSAATAEGNVLTVSGTIVARERIEISPRFMGTVRWIEVRKGDRVEKGQVLVRLEDDEYVARVKEARAKLAAAEARWREVKNGTRPEELGQAKARAAHAQARLGVVQARLKELQNGSRPEEREQARAKVSLAEGRLAAASGRVRELKNGARPEERDQAKARVALAEANLTHAEADLKRFQALVEKGVETVQTLDEMKRRRDVAAAELELARKALALIIAGTRQEQVEQAEGDARVAAAELESARLALTLVLAGPRQEQIEQAEAEVRAAEAEFEAARQALALSVAGPRQEQIEQAEAEVQMLTAAVLTAETYLNWAVIKSPVNGIILEKLVDPGELVVPQSFGGPRGPSTALVSIADLSDLQVEIDVSESDIPKVSLNQPCRISPEAYPERHYEGFVAEIAPEANRQKGTLEIKVQVKKADRFLTPELTARVDFLKK